MFYLIAAVWIIGCMFVCVLRHAKAPHLIIACPCLALGTLLGAVILFVADKSLLASVTLGVGLFLAMIVLMVAFAKRENVNQNG